MFKNNPDFYPTPKSLFNKMWAKLSKKDFEDINYVLEPSAGKGDIIEHISDHYRYSHNGRFNIHVIEKDYDLACTLQGKNLNLIDYDFLQYSGNDKYDLIIANPPFSNGELHLLKAIDILYSGHIVFLLNAETIKNPYTNTRKLLVKKLDELKADIEYIPDAFLDPGAQRKTGIEIALIHIHVKRKIEQDLFGGVTNAEDNVENNIKIETKYEIMEKESITAMVADYNRTVTIGTQTLLDFFKNYQHVGEYLDIVKAGEKSECGYSGPSKDLTYRMKSDLNSFIKIVRKKYWESVLKLERVQKRMTTSERKKFYAQLQINQTMDFTESNIRTFILNLINSYDTILIRAVGEIFNKMTLDYAWDKDLHIKNTHYFKGWATNKAYYVNNKVIIPFYGDPFWSNWDSKWKLSYHSDPADTLNDIDRVMNYFDDCSHYTSIAAALQQAFDRGESRNINSTYFKITVYKKGTIHLVFKDLDILRRFNITACKHKNWLPHDYGQKVYDAMDKEAQEVINNFEGKQNYNKNINPTKSLFRIIEKDLVQLPYITEQKQDFVKLTPSKTEQLNLFEQDNKAA